MKTLMIGLTIFGLAIPLSGVSKEDEVELLNHAAAVLTELHGTPDNDVPQSLWSKARCVVVVPDLARAAFVVGGEFGKGAMSCRTAAGGWTAPAFMEVTKGSFGLQIGAASIDLVLLVMNERGMEKLLSNKVTLGVEATVAAGPVGRNAEAATDIQLSAEILSYSRSRGLFAGVNIAGGVLKPEEDDNERFYGRPVSAREILIAGTVPMPPEAGTFIAALRHHGAAK